jgi:4'-phosphopantetheinyl transferase
MYIPDPAKPGAIAKTDSLPAIRRRPDRPALPLPQPDHPILRTAPDLRTLSTHLSPSQLHVNLPPLDRPDAICIAAGLGEDIAACHAALLPLTSPAEHARAAVFAQAADAARHLLGRALLRTILHRELAGWTLPDTIPTNAWGKPELPGSGLEFSIAHAGQAVWLAVTRAAPIGIDIETDAACGDPFLLADALHPEERADIHRHDTAQAAQRVLRCWTRKEAVVKADGRGLSCPLDGFRVRTDDSPECWLLIPPPGSITAWACHDLPAPPGYHASLAAACASLPVTHLLHLPWGETSPRLEHVFGVG